MFFPFSHPCFSGDKKNSREWVLQRMINPMPEDIANPADMVRPWDTLNADEKKLFTLSVILFIIVALSGGMFGKSIGGGVGSVMMALACAQITKRAMSEAKGFNTLRKIAFHVTKKLGTSFRNSRLAQADFSKANIHNTDFSGADLSSVNWGEVKTVNLLPAIFFSVKLNNTATNKTG